MFGISGTLTALLDCISQLVDYKNTKIENQETTDILDNKKDLEKASDLAEQIIEIARKYETSMNARDKRKLKSLIKRFNKVD